MCIPRKFKIEEFLLARMHPVLEHRSFSELSIRLLEQNLGLVIAYQPLAAVSFYVGSLFTLEVRTAKRTCNRLREHLQHRRMIRADDGTSISDPENLLLDKAEFFVTRIV